MVKIGLAWPARLVPARVKTLVATLGLIAVVALLGMGTAKGSRLALPATAHSARGEEATSTPRHAHEVSPTVQDTATVPGSASIHTFELTEAMTAIDDNGDNAATPVPQQTRSTTHVWYQAPDQWRYEMQFAIIAGTPSPSAPRITVANGTTIWTYDPQINQVNISPRRMGGPGKSGIGSYGGPSLQAVLKPYATCYHPKVSGEDTVAGRPAYVVDLGAASCPSADAWMMNGPTTIWLDKQTFFVLKWVVRDVANRQIVYTREVTNIAYNPTISASLFTFTPPSGAKVQDSRPRSPQSGAESQLRIAASMSKTAELSHTHTTP